MPEGLQERNLITLLTDYRRRLFELERHTLELPEDIGPLRTYRAGSPLGETLDLDFTGNLSATLIGDGFVRVTGISGDSGFDAIVDGTLAASDTSVFPPLFQGIGEACEYLDGLGFESVVILVRNNHTDYSSSGNLAYTETADFNCPSSVRLWGARGGTGAAGLNDEQTGIYWDLAGFQPIAAGAAFTPPDFYIHNFAQFHTGIQTNQTPFRGLWLDNVQRVVPRHSGTGELCAQLNSVMSSFDIITSQTIASVLAVFVQCDIGFRTISGATGTFVLGGSHITMVGCNMGVASASSGAKTLALPSSFYMQFTGGTALDENRLSQTIGAINMTIPGSAVGELHAGEGGGSLTASSAVDRVRVTGRFGDISFAAGADELILDVGCNDLTVGTPASGQSAHIIRAQCRGSATISGPANVELELDADGRCTFTNQITGSVISRGPVLTSGAFLTGTAMLSSSLLVVATGGSSSGTAQPYNLNASSTHVFLMWPNLVSWTNAGTNSGTNNRIETTPGPSGGPAPADADYLVGTAHAGLSNEIPVGTTPGGELGGTWAAPTVDPTHSGSAHADFIAKALAAAKGDIFTATANDTPAILTVGTDTFVLTANAATATGLEWVNVNDLIDPFGGTPTRVVFVASDGSLTEDAGLTYDPATDIFTVDDQVQVMDGATRVATIFNIGAGFGAWAGGVAAPSGTTYAITQGASGDTYVNASTGQPVSFMVNNVLKAAVRSADMRMSVKFYPATDAGAAQTAAGLYGGTGAPNNANGANGDFYFRSDGGALTTIYHKRAGVWVGVI